MIEKIKAFWARVQIQWHVIALAFLAALPEILNYLGVVDLRPILGRFLPAQYVDFIVGVLPFVLAFVKPMVAIEKKEADE